MQSQGSLGKPGETRLLKNSFFSYCKISPFYIQITLFNVLVRDNLIGQPLLKGKRLNSQQWKILSKVQTFFDEFKKKFLRKDI